MRRKYRPWKSGPRRKVPKSCKRPFRSAWDEKEADIATLRSMGATDSLVRRIFRLEGWLVSLVGIVIGLVLGVALVLLQQQLGLVPMPGNFIVDAYPVVLRASDLLWTVAGVALIGYLMALLPTRKI